MNRRGFTLVELLIVVTLLAVVLGAIYQSIAATQRTTGVLVQRMDVQQNTRAAALYLTHVLRELDAAEGDIVVADPATLRVRGMRWAGILCSEPNVTSSWVRFTVRGDLLFGSRAPDAALDSVLLYSENDPDRRDDDTWLVGGLLASSSQTCDDGSEGTRLEVQIRAASGGNAAALAGVTAGAPVRGFQAEEYSLYAAEGKTWLGHRTAQRGGPWTEIRPLAGPLTADGLAFQYFTRTGATAATPQQIASVGLTLHGRSTSPVGGFGYVYDSVKTRVALRNNARY